MNCREPGSPEFLGQFIKRNKKVYAPQNNGCQYRHLNIPLRLMAMLFGERGGAIEGKETKRRVDSKSIL